MNDAALLSKLALLPENFRSEVVDFVDFLMQKAERQQLLAAAPKPVFGSAKGMFRMAPDFDEPLADFEDYMHEMKNLLDTHTLIWFLEGDSSLSSRARQLIQAPAALNFVSMASVWEIAIKTTLNKLGLQRPFSQLQVQLRGQWLSTVAHHVRGHAVAHHTALPSPRPV